MRTELLSAARTAVVDCLALQRDESCLVVTDPSRATIGRALWEVVVSQAPNSLYVEMPEGPRDGAEPPPAVAQLMCEVDVVVAPTKRSLTHTQARRDACAMQTRVATLPGINETTMVRCLNADYRAIAARAQRAAELLTRARRVHVWTESGTDITFSVEGIEALASTGLILQPGNFGNLPSGEAYLRPLEGTAEGRVVIDGSMAGVGALLDTDPIVWDVSAGRISVVEEGDGAAALGELLASVGPGAYLLAEFGVGTNDAARVVGNILEDEKVLGTVHFAVGNNVSMGGTNNVPIHLDGVLLAPNADLDDRPLLRDGKLQLDV